MKTIVLCLAAIVCLYANPAGGDPRKEKLYATFLAPCCWRENLMAHHSPKADQMRSEIHSMMVAGRSDEQIKQELVDRYTQRILALPEGAAGEWLAWTPWAALLAGLGAVAWFIGRSRSRAADTGPPPAMAAPDLAEMEEWL
jgi:cytochrome c-type biogenesis protein CcmH